MRSISAHAFVGATIILLCIESAGTLAFAQSNWLGTIPKEEVGCIKTRGKIESIDLGKLLLDSAKAAGVLEVGYPILSGTNPTVNSDGTTDLEACALYKGPMQSTSGFQPRLLPASPGAFTLCEGTDTKACSESLLTWIRTKSPQFNALPGIIPLFGYSTDKLDATKQAVDRLISQTFPILGDETASKVPQPATDLDKQLYGQPAQPRQPRPLVTQFPAPLDVTKKGGEQHYNAVLVFLPINETEKTALGAP